LDNVIIPQSVISIEYQAFHECSNLMDFTCLAITPPSYNNVLGGEGWPYPGTIYVPAASVEAYKAADGWKNYASKIQAIPE
jgi:hypothetical protein